MAGQHIVEPSQDTQRLGPLTQRNCMYIAANARLLNLPQFCRAPFGGESSYGQTLSDEMPDESAAVPPSTVMAVAPSLPTSATVL